MIRWSVLGVVLGGDDCDRHRTPIRWRAARSPSAWTHCVRSAGSRRLYSLISGAGFVEKTAASAVVLLVGMVGMALVMRRSFCGQICPLGALQGLFGSLGGKLFRKRPEVPKFIDRPARFLKYGILAFFTIWTWQAASLVMRPYDPWVAYAHITSSELLAEFAVGVGILALSARRLTRLRTLLLQVPLPDRSAARSHLEAQPLRHQA